MGFQNWKEEIKHNITTAAELVANGFIRPEDEAALSKVIERYPMSITKYYLSLIENHDYTDPIYKMSVASLNEKDTAGKSDTSGEQSNTVSDGIQHKYDNTVLLLSTNVCAMYCRHCFRKRMVGNSEKEVLNFVDQAVDYIKAHPEVDNVLITGGDALMNSNKVIEKYLRLLCEVPHIKFVRFGTRTPVVFPNRILKDNELIKLLAKYTKRKAIYIVTQFNHPAEITPESMEACETFRKNGIPVLNQAVLLAGINDNSATLINLFNNLVAHGITPYYLFQCRPVKGVKGYFSIPLLKAVDVVDATRAGLSGPAKRFRFSMSHITGKIEIIGKTKGGRLLLKQHQAKNNEDLNNLFTVAVNEEDTWLPDQFDYQLL
ncbi:MAG: KamA family radical SAM protein [Clostridia bacterium]|nr:KamA family radical SAM protein [Clostridia bacterium]